MLDKIKWNNTNNRVKKINMLIKVIYTFLITIFPTNVSLTKEYRTLFCAKALYS